MPAETTRDEQQLAAEDVTVATPDRLDTPPHALPADDVVPAFEVEVSSIKTWSSIKVPWRWCEGRWRPTWCHCCRMQI